MLHGVPLRQAPHVPLVDADLDLLVRALLGTHGVRGGDDAVDEAVHVITGSQEAGAVLDVGVDVAVHGDVVDLVVVEVEDGALPVAEGGHLPCRGAAGHELQVLVHHLHGAGGGTSKVGVVLGVLVADLPGAVHLVAQAPHAHVVGLGVAVVPAHVRVLGTKLTVGVVEDIDGVLLATGAEVDRHHRLNLCLTAPLHELVQPEGVGLGGVPGQLAAGGTLGHRADAILPAVVGHEVAAGVPGHRDAELAHEPHDVLTQAVLVSGGVVRLEDAGVDAPTHVLHEDAVHAAVDLSDRAVGVNSNTCLSHQGLLQLRVRQARQRRANDSCTWRQGKVLATLHRCQQICPDETPKFDISKGISANHWMYPI